MQDRFMINRNDGDGIARSPQAKQGIRTQPHLEPSVHLTTLQKKPWESIARPRYYERHHKLSWKCYVKTRPAPLHLSQTYGNHTNKEIYLFNAFSLHINANGL